MPDNVDDNSWLTESVYVGIYGITHVLVSNDCPFWDAKSNYWNTLLSFPYLLTEWQAIEPDSR